MKKGSEALKEELRSEVKGDRTMRKKIKEG
jgi:hypothetical protein